jgi:hypothetical protein
VQAELERGDHTVRASAAAQRPEQVVVGGPQVAVGRDDLRAQHAVGRETVPPGQPAEAAAQRVADHADVGRRAGQRREPERRGRGQHVAPPGAGAHPGGPGRRVDLDGRHRAGVQQQRVVVRHVGAVAGGLDGERQVVAASGKHRGAHVRRAGGPDHGGGARVQRGVEGAAEVVVARVAGTEEGAGGTPGRCDRHAGSDRRTPGKSSLPDR